MNEHSIHRSRLRVARRGAAVAAALALVVGACSGTADTAADDPPVSGPAEPAPPAASPTSEPLPAPVVDSTDEPAPAAAGVDEALAALVPDGSPGAILRVDVGGTTLVDTAVGEVALDSGTPLTPQHPFRIASTTKPITAATVLRLQELGVLDIDDRAADYLPADLVAELHVVDGVSRGDQITIRHLLSHSAGLADRPFDTPFIDEVGTDPDRVWQPRELVEFGIAHAEPVFEPGADTSYSDDGYVLLGMVVEEASGRPLHEMYRELVLDPLGMDDTYLEGHEPPRGLAMSHPYIDGFDGAAIHPSTDWGGGGLVSTVADLVRFGTAIDDGSLFEHQATLDEMVTDHGGGYGLGLYLAPLGEGLTAIAHDGFWGSVLVVIPELDLVLAATMNQFVDEEGREDFASQVIELAISAAFGAVGEPPRPDDIDTVDVDGRSIAYHSAGEGEPTVVFEAGLGGGMEAWTAVAAEVADSNRVFVYDRAGYGDSDAAPGARDGLRLVAELRAALAASGHRPPYVLVGHSLGGTTMELFARTHPDEVRGLVLVDSRPAGFTERCEAVLALPTCAVAGDGVEQAPEPVRSEALAAATTERQVHSAPPLGEIEAIVLAATQSSGRPDADRLWLDVQRELAVDLGARLVIADGGHHIQAEHPELVVDAIAGVQANGAS